MARIDAFLKLGMQQGCSDVHLAVGVPPMLRMNGDLMPIKFRDVGDAELESYLTEIFTKNQSEYFGKGNDLDFSYVSADGGRFRVNVFRKETGLGATFRAIPQDIPSIDKLALPPIVKKLCDYHQGMVLVTGATGTGKSTTLAAMIDHLNTTRRLNIISLEDPIEFVHRSKQSQVIQRELGTHIPSFAEGVRAAMREDPDVILVGELRDAETISMAMTAAETGHLVLGTLHTTSASKTIDRIIDALPIEEREQTKSFLSQSLLAVVTQILVKTADNRSRKAICETLVMTRAIAKLIQTDQTHQIPNQIQTGQDLGMQLHGPGAARLAGRARKSIPDDAVTYASDRRPFQRYVTDTTLMPKLDVTSPTAGRRRRLARARRDARHRRIPQGGAEQERLGPAFPRRRSAAHPPVRRSAAAAPRPARQGIRAEHAVRNHAEDRGEAIRRARRRGLRLQHGRIRPLPRQRHAPAERHGRGDARHSVQGAVDGAAQPAAGRATRCAAPTTA